jgi:biofilm PGA synthesis protein PgaD
MRYGKAPIPETSEIRALLARRWSHRRPVRRGTIAGLTVLFWGLWLYLVVPLVTAALWVFGVQVFGEQMGGDGYAGLRESLLAYSKVLLVIVAFLAAWIAWNVMRYSGANDRRSVARAEVSDLETCAAFGLDHGSLQRLRRARRARVDFDADRRVLILEAPGEPVEVVPLPVGEPELELVGV